MPPLVASRPPRLGDGRVHEPRPVAQLRRKRHAPPHPFDHRVLARVARPAGSSVHWRMAEPGPAHDGHPAQFLCHAFRLGLAHVQHSEIEPAEHHLRIRTPALGDDAEAPAPARALFARHEQALPLLVVHHGVAPITNYEACAIVSLLLATSTLR